MFGRVLAGWFPLADKAANLKRMEGRMNLLEAIEVLWNRSEKNRAEKTAEETEAGDYVHDFLVNDDKGMEIIEQFNL